MVAEQTTSNSAELIEGISSRQTARPPLKRHQITTISAVYIHMATADDNTQREGALSTKMDIVSLTLKIVSPILPVITSSHMNHYNQPLPVARSK